LSLEALSPQLEIHQYDLYQEISYYKETREMYGGTWLGDELLGALFDAEEGNPQRLKSVLAQEEQRYESIDQCLRDFRIFIVKEIPFGSSF
jgi:5-methylcytosine-specific restriction endonuclease McrBC regulatory subunit McrC